MITETIQDSGNKIQTLISSHRLLKIVKQTHQHLVLTNGKEQMIFKTYNLINPCTLQHLKFRASLSHQGIIRINKIEVEKQVNNECYPLKCGILFEKYEKTLEKTARQMAVFTQSEIYETLQPIKEAIQFLIVQKYDPGTIKLDSIVCTEGYQIKFIDRLFHQDLLDFRNRSDFNLNVYEDFTSLAFNLFFPRQKHLKTWRSRILIAQNNLSPEHFNFILDLYTKFAPNLVATEKSKKIKKSQVYNQKNIECKRSKRIKDKKTHRKILQDNKSYQQGKQNKQIQ